MIRGGDALLDAWPILCGTKERPGICVGLDERISCLDYLLMTKNAKAMTQSIKVDQSFTASDHFPLLIQLAV